MNSIGGYFGLELKEGYHYHENAICLNTGRNALLYIISVNKYEKIFIPYFTCDVLLHCIQNVGIEYEFYNINQDLEPLFDYSKIDEKTAFLYTNYYGIKNSFIKKISSLVPNLIVDNAQSFFSSPVPGVPTFYSTRKFFGVPDGAYLYSELVLDRSIDKDTSIELAEHLLKRIDLGAEKGYPDFIKNEEKLRNKPILLMSNLTSAILQSIDFKSVCLKRGENFKYLDQRLRKINAFPLPLKSLKGPISYPFLPNKNGLREYLIEKKIFTPKFWPNVLEWCPKESIEYNYAEKTINLPVDQRYSKKELDIILDEIKIYLK